jgi:hypothetical protein
MLGGSSQGALEVSVPGRVSAFSYNSEQYLEVVEKLERWASAKGDNDSSDFGAGVLIDVDVPLSWWEDTEIGKLPFKVVYHTDSKRLFAIEFNGDPYRRSVIAEINTQIRNWTKISSARQHFKNCATSQRWGEHEFSFSDAGLDRRVPSAVDWSYRREYERHRMRTFSIPRICP